MLHNLRMQSGGTIIQCHRSHVVLWPIRHIITGGMSRAYIIRIRGSNRCLTVVSDSAPWITFHLSYVRDRTDIVQRELSLLHLKIHFHTGYSIPTFQVSYSRNYCKTGLGKDKTITLNFFEVECLHFSSYMLNWKIGDVSELCPE